MSDHRERACQECGSLLHHEDACPVRPANLSPPWTIFADKRKPVAILPSGRPGEVANVRNIDPETVERIVRCANAQPPGDEVGTLARRVNNLESILAMIKVDACDDPLLTCVLCGAESCDASFGTRGGGRRTTFGLHRACLRTSPADPKREDASARVIALYGDALGVIAGHPGGDEVAEWMKAKAREALAKTQAAEGGEIYKQIKG